MIAMRRILSFAFAAAVLAICGCMEIGGISGAIDNARTVARIGVVAHPELSWPKSAANFKKALEYYRSRKVDAIVVLGNLTKDGYLNQYRVLAQAWDDVFRNPVKGIDPNPPRRIFVLGERDRANFKPDFAASFGDDLSLEGGEFEVNGFRFRAMSARPYDDDPLPTFHSDGKMALTDELCWFPRTSVRINAGSLSGITLKPGYEPVAKAASASQGLLVTVYSGEIAVSRFDFRDMAAVADDWRMPRSGELEGKLQHASRAPEFWNDTELRVFRGSNAKKGGFYKVVWPPVLAKHTGVRANSYEVDVMTKSANGDSYAIVKRSYVLSPNFYRAEAKDTEVVTCFVYESDLPSSSALRFAVTPISSFGDRGRSLTLDMN